MSKTWKQVIQDYRRAKAARSIYAQQYVAGSRRARYTPRVARHYRPKVLADAGAMAFVRNRFYARDNWYKARLHKPEIQPTAYAIDPDLPKYNMTLEERLAAERASRVPPEEDMINVGFRLPHATAAANERSPEERARLEKMSRDRTLKIDVDKVLEESTCGNSCISALNVAKHYGIMDDLLNEYAYFHPVVPLSVKFSDGPCVHCGNEVPASAMSSAPVVSYASNNESLWTLMMVNLDGNPFEHAQGGLVHWLVTNVKGNLLETGDTLVPYLQPLPLRGTGWHRVVFVLFAQNDTVDVADIRERFNFVARHDGPLEQRILDTFSFYKTMEETLTPAGLSFCQSQWDNTVQRVFHHVLGLEQPMYKYDWPEPEFPEQEEFPEEPQPFNLYMDKYRDPLEVEERLLKERLNLSTIENGGPEKPDPPNFDWHYERRRYASWHFLERQKRNMAIGKYRALYENRIE